MARAEERRSKGRQGCQLPQWGRPVDLERITGLTLLVSIVLILNLFQ